MAREIFKVGGLFSLEDKEEIETYLGQIDGVKKVQANLDDKTVTIDYSPSEVQWEWLVETLQSLGHDTSVLS
ncbi:copper chaperone CopZ [Desulfohalotomaculum tongense]|uniref:heavy-metal-associated domain-containing protein n=1 Tax=Desulforadius tongensis TaxID=1216062 RepID=UPI003083FA05|nr:copper chaperone CopZ [Desulforadius tongensis]